jgi:putative transposase
VLVSYQKLAELTGFENYDSFRKAHQELVSKSLENGNNFRESQWTESIAVGSKKFIETIKKNLGILSRGRKILENDGVFELREELGTYVVNSDSKNGDIEAQNAYLWNINL